jgi:hypothetical protein
MKKIVQKKISRVSFKHIYYILFALASISLRSHYDLASISLRSMASLAREDEVFVELPETLATIVDPQTQTISHVPVEELYTVLSDSKRFNRWNDRKGNYFYSLPDSSHEWTFVEEETIKTFKGLTYIVGFRSCFADRSNLQIHPPNLHQRYIKMNIRF